MKKLLILFCFLLFLIPAKGQLIINVSPTYQARAVASSYPIILDDGNTKGWYMYGDGSATYMTDDGTYISNLKDQSGNSNNLLNAAGTDLPTKDAVNSEIDCDGSDDFLIDATFSYSQPATVYLVFKENTFVTNDEIMEFNGSTAHWRQRSTSAYWGVNFGSLIQGNTGLPIAETMQIGRLIINGASSSAIYNAATTVTSGNAGAGAMVNLSICAASNPAAISVKELIVRTGVDTGGNQTIIVNYLNAKYSIFSMWLMLILLPMLFKRIKQIR